MACDLRVIVLIVTRVFKVKVISRFLTRSLGQSKSNFIWRLQKGKHELVFDPSHMTKMGTMIKPFINLHSMGAEVNEQLRLYRTCDFVQ